MSAERLKPNKLTNGHSELGFGTEYEKYILRDIVDKIIHELEPRSVCEYPANDLMGNNSEIFEGHNLQISRLSELKQTNSLQYDLVWNFCEIEQANDPSDIIRKMLLLTRRYLLIVMQNRRNPGVFLHKIYHTLKRKRWNHGNIGLMSTRPVVEILSNYGRIITLGYFDVPWFILDVYESGVFLKRLIPKSLVRMQDLRKSKLEEISSFNKKWLAHHAYILFEKHQSTLGRTLSAD